MLALSRGGHFDRYDTTSDCPIAVDLNDYKSGPTSLCRSLLKQGYSPSTPIKFYRGSTLCFDSPNTVGEWAQLRVKEGYDRSVRLYHLLCNNF